jgi:hypothetical protein
MKVFLIKNLKLLQLFLKMRIKAEGQCVLHRVSVNLSEDLVARLQTTVTRSLSEDYDVLRRLSSAFRWTETASGTFCNYLAVHSLII